EARGISVETLDGARLRTSPLDAAIDAGSIRPELNPTVREVLVTQEPGGWELDTTVTHVSLALRDCVVTVRPKAGGCHRFVTDDYQSTRQQHLAVVHQRVDRAFAHAVEAALRHPLDWVEVFSIRRTEPREVRTAGRTLDEIL